jgi:hypothetical protein
LIADDLSPDIENSSSSSWSELEGSAIAQAGADGGTGHVTARLTPFCDVRMVKLQAKKSPQLGGLGGKSAALAAG